MKTTNIKLKVDLGALNIDSDLKQIIKDKFAELKELLIFCINLSPEDRKTGQKIGPKRREFTREMVDVVDDHPEIFPAAFDSAKFVKSVEQEDPLEDIETWAKNLLERVDDTHLDVGRYSFAGALDVYDYLKKADGLDELKKKTAQYFTRASKEEKEVKEEKAKEARKIIEALEAEGI